MPEKESQIFVLLSHDVEWGKRGAPISHILARRERFDENVLKNLKNKNPYQNIAEILEIEDKFGLRSTFFFRTYVQNSQYPPPSYDLNEYKTDIRSMLAKGWEVGLHSDMASHKSLECLKKEKEELENVAGIRIHGNRVHYTLGKTFDTPLFRNMKKLGFKYDSSIKYEREKVSRKDFGYFLKNGIIVFPITIMEALIFYYNVKAEADVLKIIRHAINICGKMQRKNKIVTIDWHDCSLKMKFGRKYSEVLEYLVSQKNIYIKRGIDLANMIGEVSEKKIS
jgi:peptidoglycan/xylan/chitin deacetylase (PgdA/CDA1 family)